MAQPPLSQAIQRLEGELGVRLFRRTTRRVELTLAGAAFLDESRELLARLDGAVQRVRQVGRGESGRLVAGVLGSAVHWLAPVLARAWRERQQELRLAVEEIGLDEQLAGLVERRLDVAFVRVPGLEVGEGFRHEIVHSEEICAVLPVDHPLAARERLALADLAEEPWVVLAAYEQFMLDEARAAGFTPRVTDSAHGVQTYLGLVAAGLGVGLMPRSAQAMRSNDTAFVAVDGMTTTLVMVWRDEPESAALLLLLDLGREATREPVGIR